MDKAVIVRQMQDYIRCHVSEIDFCIEALYRYIGYSKRHADRLFRDMTGYTPKEYIKHVCLSDGATALLQTRQSVLSVALQSHFQSHEGFTRAFKARFQISPTAYRKQPIPIPLFIQYPADHYGALRHAREDSMQNLNNSLCTVTIKEQPKRKLLLLRSQKATDYLSFCEEMGCEWTGMLNSIPQRLDTAALIQLPDFLKKEGFSQTAVGVELPASYTAPIPQGYEMADLDECTMLYFQGEPYADELAFGDAIESVYEAIKKYLPERHGYAFAPELAPCFNFGAEAETGARLSVPARKI